MHEHALSDAYVRETCQLGTPRCCRYLVVRGSIEYTGFACGKLDASLKNIIDSRVALGSMSATGDNCDGR